MTDTNAPAYPSKPYKVYSEAAMRFIVVRDISPTTAEIISVPSLNEQEADALLAELARTEK